LTGLAFTVAYFCAVNAVCFAAFVHDKRQARLQGWRVSERTLLLLALAGGTPAAYAARHFVRHKTRKQPFVGMLHLIALLQVAAIIAAILRPDLVADLANNFAAAARAADHLGLHRSWNRG
jgi:uncharacterized membrane protein YsdA (DUF1294 family)